MIMIAQAWCGFRRRGQPFSLTIRFSAPSCLSGSAPAELDPDNGDGWSQLFYNPEFVSTLSAPELAGALAHEVMHPALQHHTRRGDRDRRRWNIACDYAINPMLIDAGLTFPKTFCWTSGIAG